MLLCRKYGFILKSKGIGSFDEKGNFKRKQKTEQVR